MRARRIVEVRVQDVWVNNDATRTRPGAGRRFFSARRASVVSGRADAADVRPESAAAARPSRLSSRGRARPIAADRAPAPPPGADAAPSAAMSRQSLPPSPYPDAEIQSAPPARALSPEPRRGHA
jgi:hypothetical protein